jgi:hypothetical protein
MAKGTGHSFFFGKGGQVAVLLYSPLIKGEAADGGRGLSSGFPLFQVEIGGGNMSSPLPTPDGIT